MIVPVTNHVTVQCAQVNFANRDMTSDTGVIPYRSANRSSKVAGKLKVLPEEPQLIATTVPADGDVLQLGPSHQRSLRTTGDSDDGDIDEDEDEDEDKDDAEVDVSVALILSIGKSRGNFVFYSKVYSQIASLPEGTAKRDALKLTRRKAKSLPRVTAYTTAK